MAVVILNGFGRQAPVQVSLDSSLDRVCMVGCNPANKPTPANYLTALNAYLPDHTDCLLDGSMRFPYETGEAAYPKLGAAMSERAAGTVTLAQTGFGWEVPD